MVWTQAQWRDNAQRLPAFLTPLVDELGRSERRAGGGLYVQGLLLPGQRKSIEPMAERLGVEAQKLQQFITDSPWEEGKVWAAIRREVVGALAPAVAWIVDETGWLKQGRHSVGWPTRIVARRASRPIVRSMSRWRSPMGRWRCQWRRACICPLLGQGIGRAARRPRFPRRSPFATKPQMALALLAEVQASGVAPAPVLGDSAYGRNGPFRAGVRDLQLECFLQIDPQQLTGWARPVALEKQRTGWQVRAGEAPTRKLAELFAAQPAVRWHPCTWKAAYGQTRHTRLAWLKVWLPGPLERGQDHLEELWLVVDWPAGQAEAHHFCLAHLHRPPTRARCLLLSRSRWNIDPKNRISPSWLAG